MSRGLAEGSSPPGERRGAPPFSPPLRSYGVARSLGPELEESWARRPQPSPVLPAGGSPSHALTLTLAPDGTATATAWLAHSPPSPAQAGAAGSPASPLADAGHGGSTGELVRRMEALRAQLLRVSSTLSDVHARTAALSASLERSSQAILNEGAAPAVAGAMQRRAAGPQPPSTFASAAAVRGSAAAAALRVQVSPGVGLKGAGHHPFELGSPGGRTQYVALPPALAVAEEQQPGADWADHGWARAAAAPTLAAQSPGGRYHDSSDEDGGDSGDADVEGGARSDGEREWAGPAAGPSADAAGGGRVARAQPAAALALAAAGVAASTLRTPFLQQYGSAALQALQQRSAAGGPGSAAGAVGSLRRPGSAASQHLEEGGTDRASSLASSLDAERVFPWPGSASVNGSVELPHTSYLSYGSAPSGLTAASLLSDQLSVASSLDAARVHPWDGTGTGGGRALGQSPLGLLGAAGGSLELMAAAPPPAAAGDAAVGGLGSAAPEAADLRGSGSGLLVSPTVVVAVGEGSGVAAVRVVGEAKEEGPSQARCEDAQLAGLSFKGGVGAVSTDASAQESGGSGTPSPTQPCSDPSFSARGISFAVPQRESPGGDESGAGTDALDPPRVGARDGGGGGGSSTYEDGGEGADDTVLMTPVGGNVPWGLGHGLVPHPQEQDSEEDGGGDEHGAGGRRGRRSGSRRHYDGYSEEDGESEAGEAPRQEAAPRGLAAGGAPADACASFVAGDSAAAADSSFSFPLAEAIAAQLLTTASSFKAPLSAGGGCGSFGGAGGSARSSVSGGSPRVSFSGGGSPRVSFNGGTGSPRINYSGFGGKHRSPRPSRIVVPSSPRNSVGAWSQPSPVPSPYTYGVLGVRTPSSGGGPNFSLRQALDSTVSSCLFGDESDDEEGSEAASDAGTQAGG